MLVGSERVLTAAGAGGPRAPLMWVDVQDNDPSPSFASICSWQDASQSFSFSFFLLPIFYSSWIWFKTCIVPNGKVRQAGCQDTRLKGELCRSLLFGSMEREIRGAEVHVTVVKTYSRPPTPVLLLSANPRSNVLTMSKVSPLSCWRNHHHFSDPIRDDTPHRGALPTLWHLGLASCSKHPQLETVNRGINVLLSGNLFFFFA